MTMHNPRYGHGTGDGSFAALARWATEEQNSLWAEQVRAFGSPPPVRETDQDGATPGPVAGS